MDDEKLVALVEKRRVLYDRNHPKYSNRMYVRNTWEEVAAGMQDGVDATKKRWGYLRDYFKKQCRAVANKDNVGKPKKRKWFLFESMSFLQPSILSDESSHDKSALSCISEISEIDTKPIELQSLNNDLFPRTQEDAQDNSNTFHRSPLAIRNRKRSKRATMKSQDFDNDVPVPSELLLAQGPDDNELFLKSLLPMMRTLDPLESMQFRQETQGLLIKFLRRSRTILGETPTTSVASSTEDVDRDGGTNHFSLIDVKSHSQSSTHGGENVTGNDSPCTSASASPTPSTSGEIIEEKYDCTGTGGSV